MKCPECGHNQKVKYGMTCSSCRYHFALNPKGTGGVTDGKFTACIRSASQNGTTYFTRNQLYSAFCKRMAPSILGKVVTGIIALVIAGVLTQFDLWPFPLFLAFFGIAMLIGSIIARVSSRGLTRRRQFDSALSTWTSDGRTIEWLIEHPSLHEPPPDWSEPDIYDYGVERLLVVERDLLVDLFVKNGVHAEQRMLVISETGYPKYLLPIAQRLLEEQPDLPVFLLHDATNDGVEMHTRLLNSNLLPLQDHPVTDLGMFPRDFRNLKRTHHIAPEDTQRALPVDALMLPFMTMGLASAMADGLAFGDMIEQQQRGSSSGGDTYVGSDFG